MYDLIIKYFEGHISPEEKKELFSNVHTDERWKEEFIALQNLYGLTAWLPGDGDEAMASGKLRQFKQARKREKTKPFYRHWMGYAAAILISVLSTWTFLEVTLKEQVSTEPLAEIQYEEFTAPAGQRAMIKLQDGTNVWLNAQTTLRYPTRFSSQERKVELNGEAFFDVKENRDVPFIVSTGKLSVKVTGTSFNVFAYQGNEEFSTSLIEGSVTVFDPRNEKISMDLVPNERAILKGNALYKESFSSADFLLWKEGLYAFDNVPFREIAKKLELYYDVNIVINNEELANYRFNCKFRQRDGIESALRVLRNIKPFTYTKDEERNTITIK